MSSDVVALKHLLQYADLPEESIKVYSALAGLKPRTLGDIVNMTGLDYETAERAVRELMKAKLVREIPGRPTKYEALPPYNLFKMQIEDFIASVNKFEKELSNNIQRSIAILAESLNKFSGEISSTFENSIIKIATSLEEILTKTIVEGITTAMENILKQIIGETTETAKKQLEDLKESIITEFKTSVEEALSGLSEKINTATKELTETIRQLLQEKTKQQISDIIEKFELSLKAIDALIRKGFEKETTRTFDIQIIKGLDRIKGQAADIIKRAKNTLLIIAPSYDYIPVDLISKLPRMTRIQIAAMYTPKHKNILEQLKKRGITTQLRSVEGLNVFGVVADMKEALLCALPQTVVDPDKILGIFTNDENWVSMIQSQLYHIFMGASRL